MVKFRGFFQVIIVGATRTGAVSAFLRRHMNQTEVGCCVRRRVKGQGAEDEDESRLDGSGRGIFTAFFQLLKKNTLTFAPFVCEAFQFFFCGGHLGSSKMPIFGMPFFVTSRIVTFGGR